MSLEHSSAGAAERARRLNTAEAARYIGLSASTLSKLRVFGGGPKFHKIGRRVIYSTNDLDAFLQARSRTSTCDPGGVARLP